MEEYLLHNADCLEAMKSVPDGSVDMILCDPPYEVLNRGNEHAQWDNIIPFEPLWEQYGRIIKPDGAIVLFGQGMFTARLMLSNQDMWRYNLIWDKKRGGGFLNASRMPLRYHEDIIVFYKSMPTYNPQMEEPDGRGANHSRGYGIHKATNRCYGKMSGTDLQQKQNEMKYPRSIIAIPKEHDGNQVHPTQKPVALMEYLIRTYTNEGDTILDNCMGSGTTGVACANTGRRFIGMELDKYYYDIAKRRISDAYLSNRNKLF